MTDADGIIFVFGSNQAGIHGAGAAADALRHWGAIHGVGEGLAGSSYAIPTKDHRLAPRSLSRIEHSISKFLRYASDNPDLDFQVTRVGCGYAGYTDTDIAPLFRGSPANVRLPLGWRRLIDNYIHGV